MSKIVVVGSLNMDLITQTDRLPVMGETISGISFQTVCGGKGGNQAFAAAKLGGDVTMLGCVGGDGFGQELIGSLKKGGVNCDRIRACAGISSGTATITVCGGDNSIIIIPGANGEVSVDYVKEQLHVLDEAALIILQLEIPLETVLYIIDYAAAKNIPVMLNPSPVRELPAEVFKRVTYMILNETECEFFTGLTVDTVEAAKEGLRRICEMGTQNVIITLGSNGAVYNCGDEIGYEPAKKVKAADSTAAGDTFTAGVVVSLLEGKNMAEAIAFATRASAITVTRLGAQTSIPDRAEVEKA